MAAPYNIHSLVGSTTISETLFAQIADDLESKGDSIRPGALPPSVASALLRHQKSLEAENFKDAGVGRGGEFLKNDFIRTDETC